jgi:hypothetical protein
MANEKKNKKKEEKRFPKHVSIRLSYRDYEKLLNISDLALRLKEEKESKKILDRILTALDEETSADKFLNLISGLPAKERTLERFYSQPPRAAPTKMYFTDPEKSNKSVLQLHEATKKLTKGKLRYDQAKETCPTDVRVMFYAYIRGKGLADDETRLTTVDRMLRKLAPRTLSGMDDFKRNNGSLIWKICSEIRGKLKDDDEEEPPKRRGKKAIVVPESESDEEPPKRKGKKAAVVESSDEEQSSSEEESEPPKRRSRK